MKYTKFDDFGVIKAMSVCSACDIKFFFTHHSLRRNLATDENNLCTLAAKFSRLLKQPLK